jgi:hypothetical protein
MTGEMSIETVLLYRNHKDNHRNLFAIFMLGDEMSAP